LIALAMHVDLDTWPAAVLHVGAGGEIATSNGRLEALLGRDVVGTRVADLLDDGSTAKWRKVLETREPVAAVELIFHANGISSDPRAFSVIVAGDDLQLVEHPAHPRLAALSEEVAATNTDLATTQRALIIERARLAAALRELERSNAALDEFAHAVSHDLKAPLRAIKDSGEVLADGEISAAERQVHTSRIVAQVGRMRRMIDGVFEYARVGRSHGDVAEIDSARSMAEMVDYLAPPASVRVEIEPDLPVITGERVPFYQVFRNLLSNAFTYRRAEGAEVRVSARRDGPFVEFTVADNGPGISDVQQSRMWRLFQTSRPGEGTGIGLAVVKRLVEAQGGSISVTSAEGKGAAFHVRWPATRAPRGQVKRDQAG
jgi:signal transduction histidine kinase